MQKIMLTIDKISTFVGQAFSWLIVSLTFLITYEVFARYAIDAPHAWAFDIMLQMYGTLFMMAGAYTLSKNGMVRGDVLYGFFPQRVQAALDLTLYILFFLPGVTALCWAGYNYAGDSWRILEHSSITADGPPLYHFKTIIPIAGAFILVQGIVEIVRCVLCLKEGKWPSRIQDVEEVDVEKLKATVHVTDEDIAKLDEYRDARKRGRQMRKEAWFGFSFMALVVIGVFWMMPPLSQMDQRPPGPPDAGDDRHRDHARLSHRLHPDGDGNDVRLFRLLQPEPEYGGGPHARSGGRSAPMPS